MSGSERHEGAITEPSEGAPLSPSEEPAARAAAPAAMPPRADEPAERHEGAITEPQEGEPLGPGAEPDQGMPTEGER